MRPGFALLAPLLAGLTFAAACAGGGAAAPGPTPAGATATAGNFRDVLLSDLAGRPTRLADASGRRPTLVSFWAPWCEPCVREQPALQRLARQASACGAAVVGVAVGETRNTISRFTRDRKLDFAQLIDQDFRLSDALGQRRIPATLVMTADQSVVFTGDELDERALVAFQKAIAAAGMTADCSLR